MAFEIFNGTASGRTVADMNAIIDKLAEMWTFDSVDTSASKHPNPNTYTYIEY